jgi:hypothetical protein
LLIIREEYDSLEYKNSTYKININVNNNILARQFLSSAPSSFDSSFNSSHHFYNSTFDSSYGSSFSSFSPYPARHIYFPNPNSPIIDNKRFREKEKEKEKEKEREQQKDEEKITRENEKKVTIEKEKGNEKKRSKSLGYVAKTLSKNDNNSKYNSEIEITNPRKRRISFEDEVGRNNNSEEKVPENEEEVEEESKKEDKE